MATRRRDYSLVGRDSRRAVESGLATALWYRPDIPRAALHDLMRRADYPAIRDTVVWLGLLLASGAGGVWFWGGWACVPFFAIYGVLYGSASDSRWHECGHGTAFKTKWMNAAVYQLACFMVMRNPVMWRWSHARHHVETTIVGRDREISVTRPPRPWRVILRFFGVLEFGHGLIEMIRHAGGRLTAEEESYIPASERARVAVAARAWIAIYAATGVGALALGSILPLMLVGLPRIYGAWHMVLCGLLQHGALADDVLDHRLNSRTVMMNRFSRFIYWNMNYHLEHHLFPLVPYHALPRLHALLKHDLPAPTPSILAGYREMIPVFRRQMRDPDHCLRRELPATARPYQGDLIAPADHRSAPG